MCQESPRQVGLQVRLDPGSAGLLAGLSIPGPSSSELAWFSDCPSHSSSGLYVTEQTHGAPVHSRRRTSEGQGTFPEPTPSAGPPPGIGAGSALPTPRRLSVQGSWGLRGTRAPRRRAVATRSPAPPHRHPKEQEDAFASRWWRTLPAEPLARRHFRAPVGESHRRTVRAHSRRAAPATVQPEPPSQAAPVTVLGGGRSAPTPVGGGSAGRGLWGENVSPHHALSQPTT